MHVTPIGVDVSQGVQNVTGDRARLENGEAVVAEKAFSTLPPSYEAVRTNRLPCLRIGRHIRFTREMLEEWLRERAA